MARVHEVIEQEFGEEGNGVVGRGMSVATFTPELPPACFKPAIPAGAQKIDLQKIRAGAGEGAGEPPKAASPAQPNE